MKHACSALVATAALLSGCGSLPTASPATPPIAEPPVAAAWQAPLPAAGAPVADGRSWWASFDEPLLLQWIDAAWAASPGVSTAANRIAQSRAARVAAGAALGPSVDASASATRARSEPRGAIVETGSAGLQAAWEIDLFGAGRAGRDAAQARLLGSQAAWHAVRIALAAEVASTWVDLRACEAQVLLTAEDARSRGETARLLGLTAEAGLRAPADAALARAGAAQGRYLEAQQRLRCDLLVKAVVALTALDEPALRRDLALATGRVPAAEPVSPGAVPATLLRQRPDLAEAASAVAAAAADESQRRAQQLPAVSLTGSVGGLRLATGSATLSGSSWSLGPLVVSLPVFDGGKRRADVDAARAAYDDAVLQWQAALRTAVREVEDALLQLDSTGRRRDDARIAAEGYEASLEATQLRFRGGLASLFDLEDARRTALNARSTVVELQRERSTAAISLYRALGAGWNDSRADELAQAK